MLHVIIQCLNSQESPLQLDVKMDGNHILASRFLLQGYQVYTDQIIINVIIRLHTMYTMS